MTSTIPTLPRVQPGQKIRAAHFNALIDVVNRLSAAGTPGASSIGKTVAGMPLVVDPEEQIQVRITAVNAPDGPDDHNVPSSVTYDLVGIGRAGIELTAQSPTWGRPCKDDQVRIYPARLGSVHYLIRSPAEDDSGDIDSKLLLLPGAPDGEVIAFRNCPGNNSLAALLARVAKLEELLKAAGIEQAVN